LSGVQNKNMKNKKIITGITVAEQMSKAKRILNTVVIPREKEYQKIKSNTLS